MEASQGQILGALGFAISVVGTIIALVNHKRIRSTCCNRQFEASVSVDDMTPNSVRRLSVVPGTLPVSAMPPRIEKPLDVDPANKEPV